MAPPVTEAPKKPQPAKKADTLIEELIPRADEEAAIAIERAVQSFASERRATLAAAEKDLVPLLELIARRVLLRELSLDPGVLERVVSEGISALGQASV